MILMVLWQVFPLNVNQLHFADCWVKKRWSPSVKKIGVRAVLRGNECE